MKYLNNNLRITDKVINVDFIYGDIKSSAFGIDNLSGHLINGLTLNVKFNIISYRKSFNIPFSGKFYRYLYYPAKSFFEVFSKNNIIHISSQIYGHMCYQFLLLNKKIVITCADIIPLVYPVGYSALDLFFYKISLSGLKRATKIIAISESTRNDLIRYLNISNHKITVIYPNIDKKFRILDKNRVAKLKKQLFSGKKAILYVGSYLENKNIETLLKAFYNIYTKTKNVILVIVNKKENMPEKYLKLINNLGIRDNILFKGHVNDRELVEIYNCSDVFIFPSFYEGFGLPPLEAMACGCPVITSNTSSLPEVVGDAGIMVNPNNYSEIATKTMTLLRNSKLRTIMIHKGLVQARKFHSNPSEKVLHIYKELI